MRTGSAQLRRLLTLTHPRQRLLLPAIQPLLSSHRLAAVLLCLTRTSTVLLQLLDLTLPKLQLTHGRENTLHTSPTLPEHASSRTRCATRCHAGVKPPPASPLSTRSSTTLAALPTARIVLGPAAEAAASVAADAPPPSSDAPPDGDARRVHAATRQQWVRVRLLPTSANPCDQAGSADLSAGHAACL